MRIDDRSVRGGFVLEISSILIDSVNFELAVAALLSLCCTDIGIILETANGSAQTVLNYANEFLADDANSQKYYTYGKYLAFDCDDPPEIQVVIYAAEGHHCLLSNYLS